MGQHRKGKKSTRVPPLNQDHLMKASTDPISSLSDAESKFITQHLRVSVPSRHEDKIDYKAEAADVKTATDTIERFHVAILDDALTQTELEQIRREFAALLDTQNGDSAIGEKDASKRSGTRMYNCRCQVGPSCQWCGWKSGSDQTREILHDANKSMSVWEQVCSRWGFEHIKRVEVVTSHPGCRNQGWHVDAVYGLTVIFPLVDVDVRKGPTQIDFTVPFNSVHQDRGKIKCRDPESPPTIHAAMKAGSVLILNANASHRGTANISSVDRPILVLDCSPPCEHEKQSQWDL